MNTPQTITLQDAQQQLPQLICDARRSGHPFIITDNGEILAQIIPIASHGKKRQMGTLRDKIRVPEQLNHWGDEEVAALFIANNRQNP